MSRLTFSILESQREAIKQILFRDNKEYGVLLLCGRSGHFDPWTHEIEERFIVHEIVSVEENAFLSRTETSMTWSTTPFYKLLKRAAAKQMAVAVVHSHPTGPLLFSCRDDVADQETFQIAFDRLDTEWPHLAMVMDRRGEMILRAYGIDLKPQPVSLVRVIGDRWSFCYPERGKGEMPEEFDRQVRAFGRASTQDLAQLRIGVVGCGGTGSAVVSMLARIGIRYLALFDADHVDPTTLNRMHFSTRVDANLSHLKVDVVAEAVAKLGLPSSIVRYPFLVGEERCRDALCSCDLVFGCTDDHLGRNLLNHLAYFYFIPIIDLGVLIEPRKDAPGYRVSEFGNALGKILTTRTVA